ncbi:MAG TPA: hypothetical protein VLR27_16820 [Acidimicrobiales bacterium]|nr:hypothetical protein [Acidimicrobiales bacterium]
MSGLDRIEVPRRNGELAFDAPWQARVFGLAAVLVETRFDGDWEPFRSELITAIAADEARPYWESWTAALEGLLVAAHLLSVDDLDAATSSRP